MILGGASFGLVAKMHLGLGVPYSRYAAPDVHRPPAAVVGVISIYVKWPVDEKTAWWNEKTASWWCSQCGGDAVDAAANITWRCAHIETLLDGKVVESNTAPRWEALPNVELTPLGESLLRARWAALALDKEES